MNCKKIVISALLVIVLSLALTRSTIAEPEGTRTVYQVEEYGGLTIEIKAPYQADSGDEINVTLKVGATKEIDVISFSLNIYGLANETKEDLLGWVDIEEFRGLYAAGAAREYLYNITVPTDISPGLTYGIISCEWKSMEIISPELSVKLTLRIPSAGFILTYVGNEEFEQLETAYEELNASYWELNSSYTELEERHSASSGETAGARNLMYAFVATTIVSAATAVFLLIRKPKERWE
jgi:hypothetical protein